MPKSIKVYRLKGVQGFRYSEVQGLGGWVKAFFARSWKLEAGRVDSLTV
jgi:hypothetical protein